MGVIVARTRVLETSSGWPDASTTGVPAGRTLTLNTGNFSTSSNGELVEDLEVTQTLIVSHDNVTIRYCKMGTALSSGSPFFVDPSATGTVIEDSEIDGNLQIGSSGIGGTDIVARRINSHSIENGIVINNDIDVQDSFFHDFVPYNPIDDPHIDGIQFNGQLASGVVIVHNVIDTGAGSAGISFWDAAGAAHANVLIDNNKILLNTSGPQAGAYNVRFPGEDLSANNVVVTNNRLRAGSFGMYTGSPSNITTWSGNVDDETGDPVI